MPISYRFLEFELRVSEQQLFKNRKPVCLRPKTFATLQFLIENRHRVVSKEDLLGAIWPGVFVQEQAVFQTISELRSIFGAEPCIETTRGQGYQWVAGIHAAERAARRQPVAIAVAISLIPVLVGLFLWMEEASYESTAIVVHPTTVADVATGTRTEAASGMDEMLIEHLRRMGWRVYRAGTATDHPDVLDLTTRAAVTESGIEYDYVLRGTLIDYSGHVASPTPLGAVRDLASEIHPIVSSVANSADDRGSVNYLFMQGRKHLDDDELVLAEAYLRVVLAEQPDHHGAMIALAFAHKQSGRLQDARRLAHSVYQRAEKSTDLADRMVSALLLSQILLTEQAYEESEVFATEALKLASRTNDLLVIAESQEQLGEISVAAGRFDTGMEQLSLALQLYSSFCPTGETRVARRLSEVQLATSGKPVG